MNPSLRVTGRLLVAGLRTLIVLSLITGVVYPLAVLGIAQGAFHNKANGSETASGGRVVGSSLIGQRYDLPLRRGQRTPRPDLRLFQPRPSNGLTTNTVNTRYRLLVSGGTNLAGDKAAVVRDNSVPGFRVRASQVPADAVTSSGSGLDPAISPRYARLQVHRVAARNRLPVAAVEHIVDRHTAGRVLGFMGDPTVSVLRLNIALRELARERAARG
jgi:potassium-transporting ATPase KdpC subunit